MPGWYAGSKVANDLIGISLEPLNQYFLLAVYDKARLT